MKQSYFFILLTFLGIQEPVVARNHGIKSNLNISIQNSKKWIGKWIAEGNGHSCALLISPDGSWYFMNNYTRKDHEGFYRVVGNKLYLGRETDRNERIYYGQAEILYFECTNSGNTLNVTSKNDHAITLIDGRSITLRKQ